MSTTRHLGIDLGGTNIKTAVIEQRGHETAPSLIHATQMQTGAADGPDAVADRLIAAGRKAVDEIEGIVTVGLGVPGLFDMASGVVELFPNLPGAWTGYALRDEVSRGLGLRVVMINDARAFTLAEGLLGAGRGASVMLGITLGTGIGGGVMIDGHLHLGAFGNAGEFGHQTVQIDGPLCGCGNQGCLEAVARGDVTAAEAGFTDVESLYRAAASGDGAAVRAIERASSFMAVAISNAVALLGVDVVVVGGGVAEAGDLVLHPLQQAFRDRVTLVPAQNIRIVEAALGQTAGAIGAALAGMNQDPTLAL